MNTVLDRLSSLTEHINAHRDSRLLLLTGEFVEKLQNEADQVKLQIRQNINSFDCDSSKISNYLSFLQKKITSLSNNIYELESDDYYFSEIIDDLLDFLSLEFGSAFHMNLRAPVSYIANKVEGQIPLAHNVAHVMNHAGVDAKLVSLLREYILQTGGTLKTFAHLAYYEQLCDSLAVVCKEISEVDLQIRIIQELIYYNFNKLSFLHYCISEFSKRYDEEKDLSEWTKEVTALLRWVRRAPEHVGMSYDLADKSVKVVLENVILQKLADIKAVEVERREESFFDSVEPYFTLNMTVFEIAFLFRLMNRANLLNVKYTRFLHIFIHKYIRTENKFDNLSEGSIKNKYNEVSEKTKRSVKKILTTLLEDCNSFKAK